MLKRILIFACGAIVGYVAHATVSIWSANGPFAVSAATYNRHSASKALSNLHYLKIGEAQTLEESLVETVATDAILIDEMLNSYAIEAEDVEATKSFLVLLAVMDEKFEIPKWRANKKLQSVLGKTRQINKEKANKLRCLNWSKPMWVDRGSCA